MFMTTNDINVQCQLFAIGKVPMDFKTEVKIKVMSNIKLKRTSNNNQCDV